MGQATRTARTLRHLRRRWYFYAPPLVLLGIAAAWLGPIFIGHNFHTVVPGQVYRSRQPGAVQLEAWKSQFDLRTVVNLRGTRKEGQWYREEADACERLGIRLVDVKMTAEMLPAPPDLKILIDTLEDPHSYPLLFHCFAGADRTGLASAVALIVRDNAGPDDAAHRELRMLYGHLPVGKATAMNRFFELYEKYLADSGQAHSRETFLKWTREVYVPDGFRARVELLSAPQRVSVGEKIPLRVRLTNLSHDAWHFTGNPETGTVLWVQKYLQLPLPRPAWCFSTPADQQVEPGQSVEMSAELPGYALPGTYRYRLDLYRPQHDDLFARYGSRQLDATVQVGGGPATQVDN
ncbi:MAG: hypothetical protein BIFFINMI_00146 [Phycisphaerae bacterium]|nr:hypothetical protein [Phycisphaerae bacterium]